MNLPEQFNTHWAAQFPQLNVTNTRLLLAVSGGVDSVVLVDLVAKAGFDFVIAHANFQLRGEESKRDELFVRELGNKYGKPVLVKQFDTEQFASQQKLSIQEAARELRYAWFREVIGAWKDVPCSYIATAHHADDNIETLLMHFFRGTGIEGLAGMLPLRPEFSLIRPLLPFRKSALKEYAAIKKFPFVEDSSNNSNKYTRNLFRNTLLPQLKEVFPNVEDNLLANMQRFSEAAHLYKTAVTSQLNKLVEKKGGEAHIPVLKWKQAKPLHSITWELIKPYGFTAAQTGEVIRLLDAANGSYIASATHRILKNRSWMIICAGTTAEAQHILIEQDTKKIEFAGGQMQFAQLSGQPASIPESAMEALLDSQHIRYPLLLRKWKTGDYFYPLGMQKKKKLSRFLIDLKLSKTDKEKVWVLESDKTIVWVIGYRIDNRYRIKDSTTAALQISYRR